MTKTELFKLRFDTEAEARAYAASLGPTWHAVRVNRRWQLARDCGRL